MHSPDDDSRISLATGLVIDDHWFMAFDEGSAVTKQHAIRLAETAIDRRKARIAQRQADQATRLDVEMD